LKSLFNNYNTSTRFIPFNIFFHAEQKPCILGSNEGRMLLASTSDDGTVKLWDITPIPTFTAETAAFGGAEASEVNTSGNSSANSYRHELEMCCRHTFALNEGVVYRSMRCVALSPDGSSVAAGSQRGEVFVWAITDYHQTNRYEQPETVREVNSVAFSNSGTLLSTMGERIVIWNLTTNECILRLDAKPTMAAFVLDHSVLLWSNRQGAESYFCWQVIAPALSENIYNNAVTNFKLNSATGLFAVEPIRGDSIAFAAVCSFSRDGVGKLCKLGLLHLQSQNVEYFPKIQTIPFTALSYSPDGSLLATIVGNFAIKVWDMQTRQQTIEVSPGFSMGWVAFSGDSTLLATGEQGEGVPGSAADVVLFGAATGHQLASIKAHHGPVMHGCFTTQTNILL
jgi:WD40 repeat protein